MALQGADYGQQSGNTGIITSSTPEPKGARLPLTGPGGGTTGGLARPSQFTVSSEKQLVQQYRNMSPAARRALSQKLKDAGYVKQVTDKYSVAIRDALLAATRELSSEISYLRTNDPAFLETNKIDLDTFLTSQASGRGGYKGPTTVRQKVNIRPESIELTIDEIYRDLKGRGATAEEIAKYTKKATTEAAKPKNFAESIYTKQGEGMQMQEITPGFTPKEYLFQQIAKTDEAKANAVFGKYNAFKRALGVE